MLFLILFFFFFSNRRRHTRLTCDWSSDVCSSDLADGRAAAGAVDDRVDVVGDTINLPYSLGVNDGDAVVYSSGGGAPIGGLIDGGTYYAVGSGPTRSEERRVGKYRYDGVTLAIQI